MSDSETYYSNGYPVGPKHYEGWTCEECKHLTSASHFYCFEESIRKSNVDNRIYDRMHTPPWCPYLEHAIIEHIMDNR